MCLLPIKNKKIINHILNKCPNRSILCSCGIVYKYHNKNKHKKVCLDKIIKCKICQDKYIRRFSDKHRFNDCDYSEIKCDLCYRNDYKKYYYDIHTYICNYNINYCTCCEMFGKFTIIKYNNMQQHMKYCDNYIKYLTFLIKKNYMLSYILTTSYKLSNTSVALKSYHSYIL